MYKLNNTFIHIITSNYGQRGKQWLENLPLVVENCIKIWNLKNLVAYDALTYNYVLFGTMDDIPIVLKLRCNHHELEQEIAALQAFKNYGCVTLLASDISLGALLLKQVTPGTPLTSFFPDKDEAATNIVIDIITKLHQAPIPENHSFPTLEQILPTFTNKDNVLAPFISKAQLLRNSLLSTQTVPVLLHGDFHSGNVLASGDVMWTVIDPEGLIGNSLYDAAIYIRNPLKELLKAPYFDSIFLNRVEMFSSHLGYHPKHIFDWAYLQAVSSAYWSIEDDLDISNHVQFLTRLQNLSNTYQKD